MGGPHPRPALPGPLNYRAEAAWIRNAPQQPKYSMATKPEMVIGGVVPSWVNSIPGPNKYSPNPDTFLNVPPAWSISGSRKIPGGPLGLQGRLEHECGQQYRQVAKDLNQAGDGRAMSDSQLLDQRASYGCGICSIGCFTPPAERRATGASRILQSSGRSQVLAPKSRRGCTGGTGLSVVSSASLQ